MEKLSRLIKNSPEKVCKAAPALFLIALCIIPAHVFVGKGEPLQNALFFHFNHANFWHFAVNGLVIARICPRWADVPKAYLSASAAAVGMILGYSGMVCGISGIIFAIIGLRDARKGAFGYRLLAVNSIAGLIPGICWEIHLLSYLIAFSWQRLTSRKQ